MDSSLPTVSTVSTPSVPTNMALSYAASYLQLYSYYTRQNQQFSYLNSVLQVGGNMSNSPTTSGSLPTDPEPLKLTGWNGLSFPTALDSSSSFPSTSSTHNSSPVSTSSSTPSTAPSIPKQRKSKTKICTNCMATETCKWRNVKKQNVMCNACFVYERKYKKSRPEGTTNKKKTTDSKNSPN